MSPILWIIIALAIAGVWSYVAVRRTQHVLHAVAVPPGETMPMTPLQRVVWQALIPTLALIGVAVVVVARHGVIAVWDNDPVRVTVTLLLVAALGCYTYYIARLRIWLTRDDGTLDERDRTILAAAPAGQAPAMMVAMAAWMIALTERFHEAHLVPSAYLYAIFWTLLLVSVIASLLGILVGYRRS